MASSIGPHMASDVPSGSISSRAIAEAAAGAEGFCCHKSGLIVSVAATSVESGASSST